MAYMDPIGSLIFPGYTPTKTTVFNTKQLGFGDKKNWDILGLNSITQQW